MSTATPSPALCSPFGALGLCPGRAVTLTWRACHLPGSEFLLRSVWSGSGAHTRSSWCCVSTPAWALS